MREAFDLNMLEAGIAALENFRESYQPTLDTKNIRLKIEHNPISGRHRLKLFTYNEDGEESAILVESS